jgi:hypothetical protein
VIEKNKEMKFLMMKKEMKDKEIQEGELDLVPLTYKERNISFPLFLKEFYIFFQVMGLWIPKSIWISSLVSVTFI